ncbi:MAG: hypothetical protein Q7R39_13360 [Dehalococcoidia bacterium]|nr:hypothetical protein [Dehalococcoidia bacterium]
MIRSTRFPAGSRLAPGGTLHRLLEEEEDTSITEIILHEILQGIKTDEDFESMRDYLLEMPIQRPKGTFEVLAVGLGYTW